MVTWMTMPEDQTEREKFLRLYGACEKRVYTAAFRVLRDPAPAEDAAQQHTISFSDEWEPPALSDSTGEYAYLVSLVRALPEGYRRVLELKLVEEQSNQEIARRLGLNESTVATRIQRGKAMLRERLKKEGYCYE